jgi:hypothetical protein
LLGRNSTGASTPFLERQLQEAANRSLGKTTSKKSSIPFWKDGFFETVNHPLGNKRGIQTVSFLYK